METGFLEQPLQSASADGTHAPLTVLDLFDQQVQKTPHHIAVQYEESTLTYRELDEKSNQLAQILISQGITQDVSIPICVERSLEMIVGILGILKSGAAYTPISPHTPGKRINDILQNLEATRLLTQSSLSDKFKSIRGLNILNIDDPSLSTETTKKPMRNISMKNLIYIIYTSGSTGRPKGAMNVHDALCNRIVWMQNLLQLDHSDIVLHKTPFDFDVSFWEFFLPLTTGASIHIMPPEQHQNPEKIARIIKQYGITVIHFIPSMLAAFLKNTSLKCHSLKYVICSGEPLSFKLQQSCLQRFPWIKLYNFYGPTEAAIDVTYFFCNQSQYCDKVPIGKPISNVSTYILTHDLQKVRQNEIGELYLGGIALARGYLNNPTLTAEKFIENPFGSGRLYRTGDLVRELPDGNLEFIGRIDDQVKIRGFRIEPSEITACLLTHPSIDQAIVLSKESSEHEKYLVAFVVFKHGQTGSATQLITHLKQTVPSYMIPALFFALDHLPLNQTGKIDRAQLRSLDEQNALPVTTYQPPETD
ncbi:MAG TPA: amino acid adenylation domain-containing protein, partial [Gammaproteobacteria bacterium]|nr:amino acid adenylation domain-containing protein [Gammaproteobacteria bacterium]